MRIADAARSPSARTAAAAICAVGQCLLSAGCMTVRIEARDGEVKVLQHLGFLRIEPQSSRKEVVGELRGFGVVSTPMGLAAGYTRQRWAAIGPECRVVLWLGDRPLDDASLRALVDVAGLCLVDASITSAQSSLPAVAGPFKEGGIP